MIRDGKKNMSCTTVWRMSAIMHVLALTAFWLIDFVVRCQNVIYDLSLIFAHGLVLWVGQSASLGTSEPPELVDGQTLYEIIIIINTCQWPPGSSQNDTIIIRFCTVKTWAFRSFVLSFLLSFFRRVYHSFVLTVICIDGIREMAEGWRVVICSFRICPR